VTMELDQDRVQTRALVPAVFDLPVVPAGT
jgi:hypothetical protein